ncbi:MAG: TAXI family TRAP transporter solute-binding subunit [Beijerinckiaceae bacterium]
MHRFLLTLLSATALGSTGAAQAQVIGIVTTPPGSFTNSIGAAVAKVLVENAKLGATVQPQQSHGHEPVNAGTAELSIANSFDIKFFVEGKGEYEGRGPRKNIRIVARMASLFGGIMVQKDSPIKTIAELKGKRIGSRFGAQKTVHRIWEAYLSNSGMGYKDVKQVAARNIVSAADDFSSGKTDAFMFALGSAKVKQVAARVGGLRVLPMVTDKKAVAAVREYLPGAYPLTVQPSKNLEEIRSPTPVIAYDMLLFTNSKVSDDTVYKIAKALHDNKASLVATFRPLARFEPDRMAVNYEGLEYHPGAIKFFKESKNWPPKEIDG